MDATQNTATALNLQPDGSTGASTKDLLTLIVQLLSQQNGTGTPPDASKIKNNPTNGVGAPTGTAGQMSALKSDGTMGDPFPYGGPQSIVENLPDGSQRVMTPAPVQMGSQGALPANGGMLTASQNQILSNQSQGSAINQLAGDLATLLKQYGSTLTDHPANTTSALTGTPANPPAATPQPVYTPYTPVAVQPLPASVTNPPTIAAPLQVPTVGATQSLGTLNPSAPDTGMSGLSSGAYSGGGGTTVGDTATSLNKSTIAGGIQGIASGIGTMFKGVNMSIPQPGGLPPLSQFRPPTMA